MADGSAQLDSLVPAQIAERAEAIGAQKCRLPFAKLLVLGVLAGAFISLGAVFSTTVAAGGGLPFGLQRILVGLAFCLGLVLVVAAGAELFTGNNLIVMAWARRRVSTKALLRNWAIVYLGNAIGALGTVALVLLAKHHEMADGAVGEAALRIGVAKVQLGFLQALALGVLCNALVCLAVWVAMSARTLSGKILAVIFPVTAFVAMGFEHSIANLYFVPYAVLLDTIDPSFVAGSGVDTAGLAWGAFLLKNLLPVTLGNILGGAGLVALVYWFVYLRDLPPVDAEASGAGAGSEPGAPGA
jgi:formate transporter